MIPTDKLSRYRDTDAEDQAWKYATKEVASIFAARLPFRRRTVHVVLIQQYNGYAELSVSGSTDKGASKRTTMNEIRSALTALGVRKLRRLALLPGSLVTAFGVEADG